MKGKQGKKIIIFIFAFSADIQSWSEQNEDKSKQMKASAFADEDPAPFNPTLVSSKWKDFKINIILINIFIFL